MGKSQPPIGLDSGIDRSIDGLAKKIADVAASAQGLCIHEHNKHKVYLKPFISSPDLNNQNAQDIANCNPKNSSVIIGLKVSF